MQVEVSKLIDDGKWSFYQKILIAGTALTIILDGVDNQLLSLTMSSVSKEWQLVRGSPTVWTILMMSPLGMMIGGAIGGWFGDRLGRKNALLMSVIAFAIPTAAIYYAHTVMMLCALRFISGLGLGGAMPNATALSSEYVPSRFRPLAVTITIVCVPTGSMLASFITGHLPSTFGWQDIFLYGGIISFALGLFLFAVLAESPRFLANRPRRWPELSGILRRFGLRVPSDASFVENAAHAAKSRESMLELFSREYVRDTLALFGAFFFCLLVNYLAFMVLPDALETWGKLPKALAQNAMGWWSTGGIIGALAGGYIVHHFGSRLPMLAISAAAVICAFVVAGLAISQENYTTLKIMFAILGSLINAAQTTMYALAAHVYPTKIRSTGVGTAVAVGRIGNILAPVVGYAALKIDIADPKSPTAPLTNVHLPWYFSMFGIAMIFVFITLAIVRRHIERSEAQQMPAEVVAAAAD